MTTRTVSAVLGNSQRLDGGAMFGNAPRALWSRWVAPDAENRIPLACRAMLVEESDDAGRVTRRVLFETGIGAAFDPKTRAMYGVVEERHVLLDNLGALGLAPDDIDVVVLSHLHFDHAGGLLTAWAPDRQAALVFPRATFVVSRPAWERALAPHARDRASFLPELQPLLAATGRLEIVEPPGDSATTTATTATSLTLGSDYRLHFSEGHTPGLMLAEVPGSDGSIVFAGDLVPGRAWVHLPVTMGYDRYPEHLVDEKRELFDDLAARRGRLFFTHDTDVAMGRLARDERGRWGVSDTWPTPVRLAL